jgi:hypothetical protein
MGLHDIVDAQTDRRYNGVATVERRHPSSDSTLNISMNQRVPISSHFATRKDDLRGSPPL